jgi:hypothetical protein
LQWKAFLWYNKASVGIRTFVLMPFVAQCPLPV